MVPLVTYFVVIHGVVPEEMDISGKVHVLNSIVGQNRRSENQNCRVGQFWYVAESGLGF